MYVTARRKHQPLTAVYIYSSVRFSVFAIGSFSEALSTTASNYFRSVDIYCTYLFFTVQYGKYGYVANCLPAANVSLLSA
jgi:hypothetical protein